MSEPNPPPYLKAKVKIGSCKGPVSYKAQQQVFHHDDVPEYSRQRKEEVKEWAKSRIVCGDTSWDKSRKPDNPICERRRMENHVKDRRSAYQYNFRAESLDPMRNLEPFDKPTKFHFSSQPEKVAMDVSRRMQEGGRVTMGTFTRVEELPVNTKLADAASWNNSTAFTLKDREVGRRAFTETAVQSCRKVRSEKLDPAKYVSPIESTVRLQETVRLKKADGSFQWKQLITRDASLDEPVDRSVLKNRFPAERSKAEFTSHHSGTWLFNEAEGRHMWSDTGSFVYDSPGDVKIRVDPEAYSYAGPSVPVRGYTWNTNVETR